MYEEKRTNKLMIVIIVLLVLVLICLLLLGGALVASKYYGPVQDPASQPSLSEPEEPEQQSEQPEPEEPEDPFKEEESKPSSSGQPIVTPAAPSSGSSSSAEKKEDSSKDSNNYSTKTFSKSGYYDTKQKLGNVVVKTGDIILENKTIRGDMTIARDTEDTIELVDCVVEGVLYVRGGQTVVLTDTRVAEIVVKEGYDQPVTIIVDGESRTGLITAYTGVVLDESGLDPSKSGFSELKVVSGDPTISVNLIDTLLTKVTLDEETDLYLEGESVIRRLRVNEPSTIDGDGEIELLVIGSDEITSYIIPDEEEKVSKRYDDVDYASHDVAVAAPVGLAVEYTDSGFVFSWKAGDANASGYEVEMTAEGTSLTRTVNALSVAVDESFLNKPTAFKVRALTSKQGYSASAWSVLNFTPAQVGEISNFTIDSITQEGVVFVWDAVANADSYLLTYQLKGAETAVSVNDITGTSHTVAGLDLTNGKVYDVTLKAVGAAGARPAEKDSVSLSFSVGQLAKPVVSASCAEGKLTFGWQAVEKASAYELTGSATTYIETDTGFAAVVDAAAGGNFDLTVKATGGFNQTEGVFYLDSEPAEKSVAAAVLNLAEGSLKVADVLSGSLTAEWAEVAGAAGYDLVLSSNETELVRTTVAAPAHAYTYTAVQGQDLLLAGSSYSISVQPKAPAYDGGAQLYLDGAAVLITYRIDQTPAIEGVVVTPSQLATGGKLTLSWTKAEDTVYTAAANAGQLAQTAEGFYTLDLAAGQSAAVTLTAQKNAGTNVYYLPTQMVTQNYSVKAHADTSAVTIAVSQQEGLESPVTVSGLNGLDAAYTYRFTAAVNGTVQNKTVVYDGTTPIKLADLFNDGTVVLPAAYSITLTAADAVAADNIICLTKTVATLTVPNA